jgi:hypothetical protein
MGTSPLSGARLRAAGPPHGRCRAGRPGHLVPRPAGYLAIGLGLRTFLRSVSGCIPESVAMCAIGRPFSSASRTPRRTSSSGYFFGLDIARQNPFARQDIILASRSPSNPGRLNEDSGSHTTGPGTASSTPAGQHSQHPDPPTPTPPPGPENRRTPAPGTTHVPSQLPPTARHQRLVSRTHERSRLVPWRTLARSSGGRW